MKSRKRTNKHACMHESELKFTLYWLVWFVRSVGERFPALTLLFWPSFCIPKSQTNTNRSTIQKEYTMKQNWYIYDKNWYIYLYLKYILINLLRVVSSIWAVTISFSVFYQLKWTKNNDIYSVIELFTARNLYDITAVKRRYLIHVSVENFIRRPDLYLIPGSWMPLYSYSLCSTDVVVSAYRLLAFIALL